MQASPCNIAPQFLNEDSSFRDLPRVPKLDLGKLIAVNENKRNGGYTQAVRASTSEEDFDETSFGEDSKSTK